MKIRSLLLIALLGFGAFVRAQDTNGTVTAAPDPTTGAINATVSSNDAPSGTGLTAAEKEPGRLMFLDGTQQLGFKLSGPKSTVVIQHQIFQDDPDNSTETTAITSVHAIDNKVNVAMFPVVFGVLEYQELNGIDGFQLKSNERQSLHVFGPSDWTAKPNAGLTSANGTRVVSISRTAVVGATTWNFTYSAQSTDLSLTPAGGSTPRNVKAGSLIMDVTKTGGANIDDLNQPCLEIIFVTSNNTLLSNPTTAPDGTGEMVATNSIGDEMIFTFDNNYMSGGTAKQMMPSINFLSPEESGQANNTFVLGFFCMQANEDMQWKATMSFLAASS